MSVFLLLISCESSTDPLAGFDKEYTEIMVNLGAAERDNARNVRNKEARQRRIAAETSRVRFFRKQKLHAAISEARAAEAGSLDRAKGEAYWLEMIQYSSWTADEKEEETRLLGQLEEQSSSEVIWSSPDGATTVALDRGWGSVSEAVGDLDEATRAELFEEYINHQMQVVDEDFQDETNLRNADTLDSLLKISYGFPRKMLKPDSKISLREAKLDKEIITVEKKKRK